jgi:Delta24-sterol reductase
MEFPQITIGGGFAGMAGESGSFKYGIFDCIVNWIEIILGNGDCVRASASDPDTADLFYGAAGSCGSLGVVTLLELQLVEAKPFVALTYNPVGGIKDALQMIQNSETDAALDFMDGIIFSENSAVIMTGKLSDASPKNAAVQRFTRARDPWFYLHAQAVISRSKTAPVTEYIPLFDYLFRYDRGIFWGGARAFKYFKAPFNAFTRFALDPLMRAKVAYHALHESGMADRTVIQDIGIPYSNATEFVKYLDGALHMYPLWLCPLRPTRDMRGDSHKSFGIGKAILPDEMVLYIGVWGLGPSKHDEFVKLNCEIESKIQELRGNKCLYAHVYYPEHKFWEMYDREWYDGLRAKYHAENLPSVFEKVSVKPLNASPEAWRPWLRHAIRKVWFLNGIYGVYKAVAGGDYLLNR